MVHYAELFIVHCCSNPLITFGYNSSWLFNYSWILDTMATMRVLVSVVCLLLGLVASTESATTSSFIPLSANSWSFTRGTSSAVVVDLYIDLGCSDTASVWSQLKDVVKNFENDVQFQFHLFPLPYHQQSFILSKAAFVVDYYGGHDAAFTFMDTCFALQPQIFNDATADMTYNQVTDLVGTWAVNGTGVTNVQYREGMNRSTTVGGKLEMNTRYMWKYSALHEVFGTPLYYIGGVFVTDGLNTYDDWVNALTPLLDVKNGK
jgi:hypothetical protein